MSFVRKTPAQQALIDAGRKSLAKKKNDLKSTNKPKSRLLAKAAETNPYIAHALPSVQEDEDKGRQETGRGLNDKEENIEEATRPIRDARLIVGILKARPSGKSSQHLLAELEQCLTDAEEKVVKLCREDNKGSS